jgi:hypothetical protein
MPEVLKKLAILGGACTATILILRTAGSVIPKTRWKNSRAALVTSFPVMNILSLSLLCVTFCLVGAEALRCGVQAHIWNSESFVLPFTFGISLLYVGLWLPSEFLISYRAGEFKQPPQESLWAGFAELSVGDLRGFWQKALLNPPRKKERTGWALVEPRWNVTIPRIVLALTINLAAMVGPDLQPEIGAENDPDYVSVCLCFWHYAQRRLLGDQRA